MPIRIRLFLIILCISLVPLGFVFFLIPQFPQTIFTNSGAPILLMLFMLVILITLVALFVAVYFTLPLTQLREVSQKVQSGEFDQRANIKKGDEIGELAQAFNTMIDALQNQQVNLQSTVTHATKELSEKVTSLEDTKKASLNLLEDLEEEKGKLSEARIKDQARLASIGDGIVDVDAEGKVMILNKAACDMFGISAEEITGKKLIDVVKMEDEKGHQVLPKKRPFTMALSEGKTTTTTTTTTTGPAYYYLRKDGSKFPAAITATPVILDGNTIGAIEVFRDITAERSIDRAKSEFVSLASHQLRTPLSAIKWYSKMLLNKDIGELTAKQKEYLEEIHSGNERMVSLVNALLNVSRIEMGTLTVQLKKINIVTICKEILGELKQDIISKKLHLTQEYTKVSFIQADSNYIRIILQNLINNAIKYTPEKGAITIAISENASDLLISVQDTGYGIPEKAKKNIFTKLYRADNVIDKDTTGTGLGLYITKSMVEQIAKGKIWFESSENKGTTFFVSLPLTGMTNQQGVKGLL